MFGRINNIALTTMVSTQYYTTGTGTVVSSTVPTPTRRTPQKASTLSTYSHSHPAPILPPNVALNATREVGGIVRPIILPQPIPNSYWATPNLVACEYPWAPLPTANIMYPAINIRCPSLRKLIALILAGVRTFIDLTELKPSDIRCSYEPLLPGLAAALTQATGKVIQLNYYHVPIEDRSLPSKETITKLLVLLRSLEPNSSADNPHRAAIHCKGGIGRTGTIVGCYLMYSGRAKDGQQALDIIKSEWQRVEKNTRYPESPEIGPQLEYVRSAGWVR